jgi:tRNA(Arg) A34 adenosine deaminase TadA
MQAAIAASRAALAAGNRPYGAALVAPDGRLLLTAQNSQVTEDDCTAHAELALVRQATRALGAAALQGSTVYASGEPCAMCAGALFWAGVRRVVFAVPHDDMAELLGGPLLPVRAAEVLGRGLPPVAVDGPLMTEEAVAVLREAAGE